MWISVQKTPQNHVKRRFWRFWPVNIVWIKVEKCPQRQGRIYTGFVEQNKVVHNPSFRGFYDTSYCFFLKAEY